MSGPADSNLYEYFLSDASNRPGWSIVSDFLSRLKEEEQPEVIQIYTAVDAAARARTGFRGLVRKAFFEVYSAERQWTLREEFSGARIPEGKQAVDAAMRTLALAVIVFPAATSLTGLLEGYEQQANLPRDVLKQLCDIPFADAGQLDRFLGSIVVIVTHDGETVYTLMP